MTSGRFTLRRLPPLPTAGLRDCQVAAVTNLERSLAGDRSRALVQMTTGSSKTYTAITAIYRCLKHGEAKKILFLVDRDNLGEQAENEFAQYVVPSDGRKFTELYLVQRLRRNRFEQVASASITTIRRVYSSSRIGHTLSKLSEMPRTAPDCIADSQLLDA